MEKNWSLRKKSCNYIFFLIISLKFAVSIKTILKDWYQSTLWISTLMPVGGLMVVILAQSPTARTLWTVKSKEVVVIWNQKKVYQQKLT